MKGSTRPTKRKAPPRRATRSPRVTDAPTRVGRRGTIVIPARLRARLGIEEGSLVIAEERDDGVLIRPVAVLPVEVYTPERKAAFLLSNAVDAADYEAAKREVRRLGLDPTKVPHTRAFRA